MSIKCPYFWWSEEWRFARATNHYKVIAYDKCSDFYGVKNNLLIAKNHKALRSNLIEVSILKAANRIISGQLVAVYKIVFSGASVPWYGRSVILKSSQIARRKKDLKLHRMICLINIIGKTREANHSNVYVIEF